MHDHLAQKVPSEQTLKELTASNNRVADELVQIRAVAEKAPQQAKETLDHAGGGVMLLMVLWFVLKLALAAVTAKLQQLHALPEKKG